MILITETQLLGITRGLHHLHSNEVIHGDLKGVGRVPSDFVTSAKLTRRILPL